MIALTQEIAAINAADGRIAWVIRLPRWENPEKRRTRSDLVRAGACSATGWWSPAPVRMRCRSAPIPARFSAARSCPAAAAPLDPVVADGTLLVVSRTTAGCWHCADRSAIWRTMLPIVVIAGRPNVGKSTLFNRLVGRRTALVADTPGVTRDRKEAEALLRGRLVRLVDTAGLEEAAPETLAGRMRAGAETAVGTADLVLFVHRCPRRPDPGGPPFRPVAAAPGQAGAAGRQQGRGAHRPRPSVLDAYELGLGDPGRGLGRAWRGHRRPDDGDRRPPAARRKQPTPDETGR